MEALPKRRTRREAVSSVKWPLPSLRNARVPLPMARRGFLPPALSTLMQIVTLFACVLALVLVDVPIAIALGSVAVVALLHVYFLILEMFLWTKPIGLKTFRNSQEKANDSAVLAANQGLYNGFLAAGQLTQKFAPLEVKVFGQGPPPRYTRPAATQPGH